MNNRRGNSDTPTAVVVILIVVWITIVLIANDQTIPDMPWEGSWP